MGSFSNAIDDITYSRPDSNPDLYPNFIPLVSINFIAHINSKPISYRCAILCPYCWAIVRTYSWSLPQSHDGTYLFSFGIPFDRVAVQPSNILLDN